MNTLPISFEEVLNLDNDGDDVLALGWKSRMSGLLDLLLDAEEAASRFHAKLRLSAKVKSLSSVFNAPCCAEVWLR